MGINFGNGTGMGIKSKAPWEWGWEWFKKWLKKTDCNRRAADNLNLIRVVTAAMRPFAISTAGTFLKTNIVVNMEFLYRR